MPAFTGSGDGLHARDVGKADAYNDRKPRAETESALFAANGENLQKGRDSRDDQRGLNEYDAVAHIETGRVGNDDGRGDAADYHGHEVLEGQGQRSAHGRYAVSGEQQLTAAEFLFVH